MSDRSFTAKLDNMRDYKVLTVANLVSILAGQPPMMEVYVSDEDTANSGIELQPRFINGVETVDGSLYLFAGRMPQIVNKNLEPDSEDAKRNAAMNMQRQSELATRMPEVVE